MMESPLKYLWVPVKKQGKGKNSNKKKWTKIHAKSKLKLQVQPKAMNHNQKYKGLNTKFHEISISKSYLNLESKTGENESKSKP